MTLTGIAPSPLGHQVERFLLTPKGILLLLFVPLLTLAVIAAGRPGAEALAVGLVAAAATDIALVWGAEETWVFPSGAMLTGLIVAGVLSVYEPWSVIAVTAAVAVVLKRIFRVHSVNVFNPAALALVIAAIGFSSGESWWGALADYGLSGAIPVAAAGAVIVQRINKWPLVLSFMGTYFLIMTGFSFLVDAEQVAEVFLAPDLNAVMFFAVFMLDDPPTCPTRYPDQVVFGVLAAASSCLLFVTRGPVYFLLAGLLVANAYEAAKRYLHVELRRRRRASILPGAS